MHVHSSACMGMCLWKPHVAKAQQQALLMAYNRVRNWFLFSFCFDVCFFPLCLCVRFPLWFSDLSFNLFARSWCVASLTHGRSSTTEAIYSALVFCHFLVILPKYCSCICFVKPLQHFAIVVSGLQSFEALSDGGGHGHRHRHRQSQHQ